MMRSLSRGVLCAVLAGSLAAGSAQAQLEENLTSLTGDQTQGYLGPLATGLSACLNSGIFKSGDVPVAGVNVTLDVKASYIGFSDESRVYTTPAVAGYPSTEAPTVVGDTHSVSVDHETLGSAAQFQYPGGFDMEHFGVAVPQLTVGSVLGTRAMVRWISLSLGDEDLGDLSLFGIGAQHSISQYLPGIPVDLAAGFMWQTFKIGDGTVDASATTFNVTGSKTLGPGPVTLVPYVGMGLDSFNMDAEYDTGDETLKVEFDRQNDFHFTLGAGLNLPVVKVHAEYNVAAENGFAGGLSFGI